MDMMDLVGDLSSSKRGGVGVTPICPVVTTATAVKVGSTVKTSF